MSAARKKAEKKVDPEPVKKVDSPVVVEPPGPEPVAVEPDLEPVEVPASEPEPPAVVSPASPVLANTEPARSGVDEHGPDLGAHARPLSDVPFIKGNVDPRSVAEPLIASGTKFHPPSVAAFNEG